MKIKFLEDGNEYEIYSAQYQVDSKGIPVDIILYGSKQVLSAIVLHSYLGCNIIECDWEESMRACVWNHYSDYVHKALYARLQPFTIEGCSKVEFYE